MLRLCDRERVLQRFSEDTCLTPEVHDKFVVECDKVERMQGAFCSSHLVSMLPLFHLSTLKVSEASC